MSATIIIRTDEEVKKACEALYKRLGLNLSSAINTFLKASLRSNGLPFDLVDSQDNFNATTIASIKEGKRNIRNGTIKTYSSMKAFRKAFKTKNNL